MRKPLTLVLLCVYLLTSISTASAQIRRKLALESLPTPETVDDCISDYKLTETSLKIQSQKGRTLEIIRGERGRVELIIQDGKPYRPIYDDTQSLASFKSLDDGIEHVVTNVAESVPPEVEKRIQQAMDSVKRCDGAPISTTPNDEAEVCPRILLDDTGGGETFGWYSDFGSSFYWSKIHRPYFDNLVQLADERNRQRSCIVRYSSCIDACQMADDMRSYSCAAFALIYISIPVAAAIGGGVCLYASNRERNRCTGRCGPFVECF